MILCFLLLLVEGSGKWVPELAIVEEEPEDLAETGAAEQVVPRRIRTSLPAQEDCLERERQDKVRNDRPKSLRNRMDVVGMYYNNRFEDGSRDATKEPVGFFVDWNM